MKTLNRSALIAGSILAAAVVVYANNSSQAEPQAGCCPAKPVTSCCPADAGATAGCAKADDCLVLKEYVPVAEALAADDLPKAKAAAAALAREAEAEGLSKVVEAAAALREADALPAARAAFKTISLELVPMARGASGYVTMTCPMAEGDWLQKDDQVRNPYYGKSMLRCGGVKAPAAPQS